MRPQVEHMAGVAIFLILDETAVYHIGASLKDLGKKWFAFSKIEKDALNIVERLPK